MTVMQDRSSYLVQLLVEGWAASFAKQGKTYGAFVDALEPVIEKMQEREGRDLGRMRNTFLIVAFKEWRGTPLSAEQQVVVETMIENLLAEEVPE